VLYDRPLRHCCSLQGLLSEASDPDSGQRERVKDGDSLADLLELMAERKMLYTEVSGWSSDLSKLMNETAE
jgi:hypothetical protein